MAWNPSSSARDAASHPWDGTVPRGDAAVLLELMQASLTHDLHDFETLALRRLGSLVGFDGAVWGTGRVSSGPAGPLTIDHARLVDRPAELLAEYPRWAPLDPATARFLAAPQRPVSIDVARTYTGATAGVGDYLRRHRISQLLLLGTDPHGGASVSRERRWITVYRESGSRFASPEVHRLRSLLPLWHQARELCLARQLERLAREGAPQGAALALCDRSGTVHLMEPAFAEATGWTGRPVLPAELLGGLLGPSADAFCRGVHVQARPAGDWLLLCALPAERPLPLPPRARAVATLYAEGLSHKEIARRLGSAPSTVRTQLQEVYRRLGVHSRTGLQRALREGMTGA